MRFILVAVTLFSVFQGYSFAGDYRWEFFLYNSYINDVSDRKATELFESAVFVHSYQTIFTLDPERFPFAVYALSRTGTIKIKAINNYTGFSAYIDRRWSAGISYEESLVEATNYPALNVGNYFPVLSYLPLLPEDSQKQVFRLFDYLAIQRIKTYIEPLVTWNFHLKYDFSWNEENYFLALRYGTGRLAEGNTTKYGFDIGRKIELIPSGNFSYSLYFNYNALPVFQKPEVFEGGLRLGIIITY